MMNFMYQMMGGSGYGMTGGGFFLVSLVFWVTLILSWSFLALAIKALWRWLEKNR